MMTETPATPRRTPATRFAVSLSSARKIAATTMPKKAVVAFRMEARPLSISVWPHVISVNGIALFSAPMTKNAVQTRNPRGTDRPRHSTKSHSRIAAQNTR